MEDAHWAWFVSVTIPVGIVIMLIVMWRSVREFRQMSKQEARVSAAPELS
ncbi:MAG: hypothetical protein JWO94_1632, partial [Verrucomicrobiaceae bacterium]|nr:hypothetical protein [Verrucomicrobiaceae bacterium]